MSNPLDMIYGINAKRAYQKLLDMRRAQLAPVQHASDCAVHNAPAYPVGPCDCGALKEKSDD